MYIRLILTCMYTVRSCTTDRITLCTYPYIYTIPAGPRGHGSYPYRSTLVFTRRSK
jgi:hypothetical protein